ncbi:MAG: hypothetical protein B0W54_18490 [Cellvibrio sp. 79]|nr:MAG: hypothetical protein B0W54_18490 [Cellvibrio sp. 79]
MSQIELRKQSGLQAIKGSYEAENAYWVDVVRPFITARKTEIPGSYWENETGTPSPSYSDILELFMFKTYGNNELSFDYTFPANVTPYVIRVTFNTSDQITGMVSAS